VECWTWVITVVCPVAETICVLMIVGPVIVEKIVVVSFCVTVTGGMIGPAGVQEPCEATIDKIVVGTCCVTVEPMAVCV
jgi:hypothetical protein